MKALVTGGGGFIGSHLVHRLLAAGHETVILDNFSTGRRENLDEIERNVQIIDGDIRNPSVCVKACCGVDAVFHEAALGSVPRSVKDPQTSHDVNITGTLNLLVAARETGVRRFVFASSSSVYGNAPERVKTETLQPRPLSPYAVTKLAAEAYTCVFFEAYGLETVALRYFNVFGPRQDPNSAYAAVVPAFTANLLAGKAPTIHGDGEQTRDFTFVDNVVDANLHAIECPTAACGKAYNIACGGSHSVNELFTLIRDRIGERAVSEADHSEPRAGDVRDSLASIDAARDALGYEPRVSFAEGITKTVDWYEAHVHA